MSKLALVHVLPAAVAVALVAVACTSGSSESSGALADAGADDAAESAVDGKALGPDAGGEAGVTDPNVCEGTCKTTQGGASFNGKEASFDRAQFGFDAEAGPPRYYVEAYAGGDPACPSQSSPTPDRTLIVAGIRRGAPGKTFTKADGLSVTMLDFKGDLLPDPKPVSATDAVVTVIAEDPAAAPQWVAIEVQAAFANGGGVKGHFYATRCASLD